MNLGYEYQGSRPRAVDAQHPFYDHQLGWCYFDSTTQQVVRSDASQHAQQSYHTRHDSGLAMNVAQNHWPITQQQTHSGPLQAPQSRSPRQRLYSSGSPAPFPLVNQGPLQSSRPSEALAPNVGGLLLHNQAVSRIEAPHYPSMNERQPRRDSRSSSGSSRRSAGSPRPGEPLQRDYKIRPRQWFKVGKVFHHLYSEANDRASVVSGDKAWTQNSYGCWLYTKSRRFVIVKADRLWCVAVPITTYGNQACAKKDVKKSDHVIIYTGPVAPAQTEGERPARGELGLLPYPIQVVADDREDKLDSLSRLDFSKPTTIHFNVRVKGYGMVSRNSLRHLSSQFQSVMLSERPSNIPESASEEQGPSASVRMTECTEAHQILLAGGWSEEKTTRFVSAIRRDIENMFDNQSSSVIIEREEEDDFEHVMPHEQLNNLTMAG